jgi:hypothetical protein
MNNANIRKAVVNSVWDSVWNSVGLSVSDSVSDSVRVSVPARDHVDVSVKDYFEQK